MADGGGRQVAARTRVLLRGRVPSERPGRSLDRGVAGPELAHHFLRHPLGAPGVTGEQLLRDTIYIAHRREQPRVSRHAAHRVGVFIIHFADQQPLAERAERGRREHLGHRLEPARAHQRDIDEVGRADAERTEDAVAAKAVERYAGNPFDRLAEQHKVEVRVDRLGGRRRFELLAMNLLVDPFLGAVAGHEIDLAALLDLRDLLEERPPCRQSRAVCQHVAESDVALVMDAEIVEEARDAVAQSQLVLAHQHHHSDGGGERLGQRRKIEDRLHMHWRALGHKRAVGEGALENDIGVATHHQRGTGDDAALHGFCESLLDFRPSQTGRSYAATAGSRKPSVRAAVSTRARTPKGMVKFALPCPTSIPESTGQSRRAACSAMHSLIKRCSASLPAGARNAPKTTAATRPSTPACPSCTSIRSILYAFSPVSSKNRIAPSKGGAYGVPSVAATIERHPPTTSPSATPALSAARAGSSKLPISPASKRRR